MSFVTVTAAETLCKFGYDEPALKYLVNALQTDNEYLLLMSARAVELLGKKTLPYKDEIIQRHEMLGKQTEGKWQGYDLYAYWALTELLKQF